MIFLILWFLVSVCTSADEDCLIRRSTSTHRDGDVVISCFYPFLTISTLPILLTWSLARTSTSSSKCMVFIPLLLLSGWIMYRRICGHMEQNTVSATSPQSLVHRSPHLLCPFLFSLFFMDLKRKGIILLFAF